MRPGRELLKRPRVNPQATSPIRTKMILRMTISVSRPLERHVYETPTVLRRAVTSVRPDTKKLELRLTNVPTEGVYGGALSRAESDSTLWVDGARSAV